MNLRDPRIDWNRHRGRYYVVESPAGVVLYLTEVEFLRMSRVWDSNEKIYVVLADPSSRKPEDSDDESGSTPSNSASTTTVRSSKTKISPPPSWWRWGRKLLSDFLKFETGRAQPKSNPGGSKGSRTGNLKFIGTLVLPTNRNIGRLFKAWAQKAAHLTGKPPLVNHVESLHKSVTVLVRVLENGGPKRLISMLKVSYIAVLKYLSGNPLSCTSSLGSSVALDRSGLPRWLPLTWRHYIRSKDPDGIRFVLSVLYMYRALTPARVTPDLSTISAPAFEGDISEFTNCVEQLFSLMGIKPIPGRSLMPEPVPSLKSGPNASTMIRSILLDFAAWFKFAGETGNHYVDQWICTVLRLAYPGQPISSVLDKGLSYLPSWATNPLSAWRPPLKNSQRPMWLKFYRSTLKSLSLSVKSLTEIPSLPLGRLAWWADSGGKTRIVALPDFWTQLCLKPVHDSLAAILKLFPQDATFDQLGRTEEFARRGYDHIWSYDLKAATDLIPSQLYLPIMRLLIGSELADLWLKLLTDRDYCQLGKSKAGSPVRKTLSRHRYTRGQPMGAYSSWPAMALVHHCLVLYSAKLAGVERWWDFRDYLVLGDDVVIAHEQVAQSYINVCESHGVKVSLLKSYISSRGMFQFASLVFVKGVNLSPASLREEFQNCTPQQRATSVYQILRKWYPNGITFSRMLKLMIPRTAWREVSLSLKGGSAHPLALCVTRTLLTPGTTISSMFGSVEASLYGWIGSFDPAFNLRSYIATQGTVDQFRLLNYLESFPVLRAATAKLFEAYTARLKTSNDQLHTLVKPALLNSGQRAWVGAKRLGLQVSDILRMSTGNTAEQLAAYHAVFFDDLSRRVSQFGKDAHAWRVTVATVRRYWNDTDGTLQLRSFFQLFRVAETSSVTDFSRPYSHKVDNTLPKPFSKRPNESWLVPHAAGFTKLDELDINLCALDLCAPKKLTDAPLNELVVKTPGKPGGSRSQPDDSSR